jgi:succinate dehydrogenase / fumarate reductase flavoprotein subunit
MWKKCGVLRNDELLRQGVEELKSIKESLKELDVRPDSEGFEDLMLAFDLEGSIASAEVTILSAIERKESRGAHQRKDFPKTNDEEYLINITATWDSIQEPIIRKKEVIEMSKELKKVISETTEITDWSGKLLE